MVKRRLTPDERIALRQQIDAQVRKRCSIPESQISSQVSEGDPTARFTDEEMLAAVRTTALAALAADEAEYERERELYWEKLLTSYMTGESSRRPVHPVRRDPLGMRRYEELRDRSRTPSCNTIRRRHGSFHQFVALALDQKGE